MSYGVGVDGYNLALPHGTGVATYARALCEVVRTPERPLDLIYGLDVRRAAAPALRETLFHARLGEPGAQPPRPTLRRTVRRLFLSPLPRDLIEVPRTGRVVSAGLANRPPEADRLFTLGNLFHLGARHFRRFGRFLTLRMPDPPAIMHWTYPVPVRVAGARNLYTIHDLVPLRLPFLSLEDKVMHEALLRRCLVEGDRILTVSEASRAELIAELGADPALVLNTAQALPAVWSETPSPDEDAACLRALFAIEHGGYFLFVGAIEPKKNVARLLDAYLAAAPNAPLLLAGPDGWSSEGELRRLAILGGTTRIRRLGHLPADQLRLLMRGARALLSPSLHEGFGLPALEAMSTGIPVLGSTAGGHPELIGDAGLCVDPYDTTAIAAAIRALDGDAERRAALGRAGVKRAQLFSPGAYRARIEAVHAALTGRDSA